MSRRMTTMAMISALVLAVSRLPAGSPEFEITKVDKPQDTVTVEVHGQRVFFTVMSSHGMGGFTCTLKSARGPREVSVALNLTNLEGFGFQTDRLRGRGGVKPGDTCWAVFEFREGEQDSLHDSPGDPAGTLTLHTRHTKEGIELIFPPNMFSDTRTFGFSWLDAYRR